MRVLLITSHYKAGPGRAETVTVVKESLLRQADHEVIPFTIREPDTMPTPWQGFFPPPAGQGARTELGARFAAIYSRPARRNMEALIRHAPPDVAHLHHIFEFLTLSVLDVLPAARVVVVPNPVRAADQLTRRSVLARRDQGRIARHRAP